MTLTSSRLPRHMGGHQLSHTAAVKRVEQALHSFMLRRIREPIYLEFDDLQWFGTPRDTIALTITERYLLESLKELAGDLMSELVSCGAIPSQKQRSYLQHWRPHVSILNSPQDACVNDHHSDVYAADLLPWFKLPVSCEANELHIYYQKED